MPKGLIPFHRYPDGVAHPVRGAPGRSGAIVRDARASAASTSPSRREHEEGFARLLDRASVRVLEERVGCRFEVGFSSQGRATDTLAVDPREPALPRRTTAPCCSARAATAR